MKDVQLLDAWQQHGKPASGLQRRCAMKPRTAGACSSRQAGRHLLRVVLVQDEPHSFKLIRDRD